MSSPRPLQVALNHINQGWIPLSPEFAPVFQARVARAEYKTKEVALKDLQDDLALFSLCLRELSRGSPGLTHSAMQRQIIPTNLVAEATGETLHEILSHAHQKSDLNRAKGGSKEQLEALVHPVVSAHIARILAPAFEVHDALAYSCALLRQLGLTLIAWNYPSVFARAISSVSKTESIDILLNKRLGFSPLVIGVTYAREWKISLPIRYGMGDSTIEDLLPQESKSQTLRLRKVVQLSEALTRAESSWYHGAPSQSFFQACEEIEQKCGSNILEELKRKLGEELPALAGYLPSPLRSSATTEAQPELRTAVPQALLAAAKIMTSSRGFTKQNLAHFKNDLFPTTHFQDGCLYLLSPEKARLEPKLALGERALSEFTTVELTSSDPVASAFRNAKTQITIRGEEATLTQSFGTPLPAGVLLVTGPYGSEESQERARATLSFLCDLLARQ